MLVTVETDDGLIGYGVGGGGQAAIHVIDTVIGPALTGQDSTDVEGLWDSMYSMTLAYGRKGLAIMAISGVDLALWDLRAKRADLPLANVLGDDVRATVPAYRTGRSPEAWINEGTEGFAALKLSLAMSANEKCRRRSRTAFGGSVKRSGPDVRTNGRRIHVAQTSRPRSGSPTDSADVDLGWFEEPLPADDLTGYARLRDECPIPIAGRRARIHRQGVRRP